MQGLDLLKSLLAKNEPEEVSYEDMSKRVADHSANVAAKKVDEKLDRLPRWMGGKKGWFGGEFGAIKEAQFYFFTKEILGE